MSNIDRLGSTWDERYRHASEYAKSRGIDLASAYSVLLGFMSLDTAPSTQVDFPDPPSSFSARKAPVASAPRSSKPGHHDYDPGFRDAVAEGYLTIWEAEQRGDRVLYASRLSRKHDLPMGLSFLVADNRITLGEARERLASRAQEDSVLQGTSPVWRMTSIGVCIVAITLILVNLAMRAASPREESRLPVVEEPLPPAPQETPRPSGLGTAAAGVEIKTDSLGRLAMVSGPDPMRTLAAFCADSSNAGLSPVAVRQMVPHQVGERIGVLRDLRDLSAQKTVKIRRNGRTRRWVIGDGYSPIVLGRAEPPR